MNKGIEWLKRSSDKRIKTIESDDITFVGSEYYDEGYIDGMRDVLYRIDQLDEPEVLSQECIEQKSIDTHVDTLNGEVQFTFELEDLQNLLVAEQKLPVIPKFVANWIEEAKGRHHSLYEAMADYCSPEMNQWIQDFYHSDLFAKAWLDGYTVEKEQKYHVNILDEGTGAYLIYYPKSGNYGVTGILDDNKGITRFTEQEIKDYDERFWPFAVKVEELEE